MDKEKNLFSTDSTTGKLVELEEQTIFNLNESTMDMNEFTVNTASLDFENNTIQIDNNIIEENNSIEFDDFSEFDIVNTANTRELNVAFEQMKVIENESVDEIAIKIEEETGIMTAGGYGRANIMVIGVGGCGCNVINRMYDERNEEIKLVAMDTTEQSLENISADYKLLLGENILKGHGTGGNISKSLEAFQASRDRIKQILKDVDMVFVAGGIGRGTGSVGLVEVGKIAREMGILTIGFATLPRRMEANMEIIGKYYPLFVESVDSNVIVENEKVGLIAKGKTMMEAMRLADSMLIDGIRGIFEIITKPGKINLDYADVRTAFVNQGSCVMGIGYGSGDNPVADAIQKAIQSEIINKDSIRKAKTIIFNITCKERTITVSQATKGSELIYSFNNEDNIDHLLFGYSYDDSLEDQVKVTFVATGTSLEPVYNTESSVVQSFADKFKTFSPNSSAADMFSKGKAKDKSQTIDIFAKSNEVKKEKIDTPISKPQASVEKSSVEESTTTNKVPDFFKRR